MEISVILPTHNPNTQRLHRTLEGLKQQTFDHTKLEVVVIDNASTPPLVIPASDLHSIFQVRIIKEPEPGLSRARKKGLENARGDICIFVDDDNVLAPDYLKSSWSIMQLDPSLGAIGGKSLPEFERLPESWKREFDGLLALRNFGENAIISEWKQEYPACAPIGAGMVLRREAAQAWLNSGNLELSDRKGRELCSGGDNDVVLCLLKAGWKVGYFPALTLHHLIPSSRLEPEYLARLNHDIQKSWMKVLFKHDINPWQPISGWTVPLRQLKAWFKAAAWRGPASYIRWRGICGHFSGLSKS